MKTYLDFIAELEANGITCEGNCESSSDPPQLRSMSPEGYRFIAELLQKRNFKNILEIGRASGFSFGVFSFFSPDSYIVSIDPYTENPELESLSKKIADIFGKNYKFITGTSENLKDYDTNFDLVFIDGDHGGGWPQKDWKNIQKHLNSKATVIFDDIWCSDVKDTFDSIDVGRKYYYEAYYNDTNCEEKFLAIVDLP
jgi:predicted O-methyltransferase YrrM